MNDNTITVTGLGSIHVVPDVTRIELSLTSIHDNYEDAYVQAKMNSQMLRKIMNEVKLGAELPKTNKLNIEKSTHSEYDRNNHYIGEKFIGFELNHEVKIDLGMDKKLINLIVRLIGRYLKQAEINIGYTVRDPRPSQLRMLERAVKDAKDKAQIMARACGCRLGVVKDIDYSFQEMHIYSQARSIHEADEAAFCTKDSLDITPDDLTVSDHVRVVWQLLNSNNE